MNSFWNKSVLVFSFVFIFFGFFSEPTKAEACQIVSSDMRPSGTINAYSDSMAERPWVYLDVLTQNCVTSPSNVIEIRFFDEPLPSNQRNHIQSIFVEIGETGSLVSQINGLDFQTSENDFTIPILLGESGSGAENGVEQLGYNFCSTANGEDCRLWAEFFNITNGITNTTPIYSLGDSDGPYILSYECLFACDTNWIVGSGCLPTGDQLLPYVIPHVLCTSDSGYILNVTPLSEGAGAAGDNSNYSTTPLAPLPGFTENPDLGGWLKSLFTILIAIAGILALIMIIVGGVTYMTSDAFGKKQDGKMYIINAIAGLILALGAWVILNTINPDLAQDLNIEIPDANLGGYVFDSATGSVTGCKDGTPQVPNCPDCVALPDTIQSSSNNQVKPSLSNKLVSLQTSLSSASFSWRVTEAFPPSVTHCSKCHYDGTCVDVNFTPANPTPPVEDIISVLQASQTNGLRAVFETNNISFKNQLLENPNISSTQVIHWAAITAPHFSIYNY